MMKSTDLRESQLDDIRSSSSSSSNHSLSSSSSSLGSSTSSIPKTSPPSVRLASSTHSLSSSTHMRNSTGYHTSSSSPHINRNAGSSSSTSSSSSSPLRSHHVMSRLARSSSSAYTDDTVTTSTSTLQRSNAMVTSATVTSTKNNTSDKERDLLLILVHGTCSECWDMSPFDASLSSFAAQMVAPRKITHKTYFDWAQLCDNDDLVACESSEKYGSYNNNDVFHRKSSALALSDHIIRKSEEMEVVIIAHSKGALIALHSLPLLFQKQVEVSSKIHLLITICAPKSTISVTPLLQNPSLRPSRWLNIYKYGDLISFLGSNSNEGKLEINNVSSVKNGKKTSEKKEEEYQKAYNMLQSQTGYSLPVLSEHYLYEPAVNVLVSVVDVFHPLEHSIATFVEKDLPKLRDQNIQSYLTSILSHIHNNPSILSKNTHIPEEIWAQIKEKCPQQYTYFPSLASFGTVVEFSKLKSLRIDPGVEYVNPLVEVMSWLFGAKPISSFDISDD
eukprot:TRINITY_DN4012_c0_g1_i2.p1 TRINITY_DN4012_c0_g1~~TRINITY_DN4012_c0_g1_i2.p1  ORF type:complete len:503 (+),score=177.25 TRINITY_DN4012_c0_g1_i2:104-1612(+)